MRRIVLAVLAVVMLTACGGGDGQGTASGTIDGITVGSDVDGAPTLEFTQGLEYGGVQSRIELDGDGEALVPGGPILLDMYAVSLTDGRVLRDTYRGLGSTPGLPEYTLFAPELIGADLYAELEGKRVGTRVLHVSPPAEGYENQGPVALVVDVLPTHATGRPQSTRDTLPIVVLDDNHAPIITLREDAEVPTTLTSYTLIQGEGEQIKVGSWVLVHYVGVDAESGQLFQSSWDDGSAPYETQIGVGLNIDGWEKGLIDQSEHSQVLLVIPAAQAYGEAPLVFVVDILAVWNPS